MSIIPNQSEILNALDETLRLIALPGNDFNWSGWHDAEQAAAEVGMIRAQILEENLGSLIALEILFAPTGPMQELSIDSGWEEEFLALADRLDQLIGRS